VAPQPVPRYNASAPVQMAPTAASKIGGN
jgi:hypothetical protein